MSTIFNVLQLLGGVVLAVGYVPQLYKLIKTKSARDFSILFPALMVAGIALMEAYAAYNIRIATAFFITNTLALVLSSLVLVLCLIFKARDKKGD